VPGRGAGAGDAVVGASSLCGRSARPGVARWTGCDRSRSPGWGSESARSKAGTPSTAAPAHSQSKTAPPVSAPDSRAYTRPPRNPAALRCRVRSSGPASAPAAWAKGSIHPIAIRADTARAVRNVLHLNHIRMKDTLRRSPANEPGSASRGLRFAHWRASGRSRRTASWRCRGTAPCRVSESRLTFMPEDEAGPSSEHMVPPLLTWPRAGSVARPDRPPR
jgi:hypothetical protein